MRLSVIGCGYLGAVHAASMAELGHDVVGVDVDAHKVNLLSNGRAPFFEPELEGLLARNVEAGRLTFTQDFSAIKGAQVHFIGVGTPQSESGAADMTYVDAAVTAMLPHLGHCTSGPEVVAGKSTVPVGTAARLSQLIEPTGALLLWNPEFLREGFAVQDTLRPDRMVYGLPENPDAAGRAQETMDAVYAQILAAGTPRLVMDYADGGSLDLRPDATPTKNQAHFHHRAGRVGGNDMASIQNLYDTVSRVLGNQASKVISALGEITVECLPEHYISVMTTLRDHEELHFELLVDLCGVDYSTYKNEAWQGKRFAVVSQLLSVKNNQRIRVRVWVSDDDFPVVESVVPVYNSADWYEREAFDLYGIMFNNHPDLRRILTDYGFVGHPFRKDFPISGYVEMRYDEEQKRVIYQPVTIEPREITPRIVREENYGGQ